MENLFVLFLLSDFTWSFSKIIRSSSERKVSYVSHLVNQHIADVSKISSRRCFARIQILDDKWRTPSWDSNIYTFLVECFSCNIVIIQFYIIYLKLKKMLFFAKKHNTRLQLKHNNKFIKIAIAKLLHKEKGKLAQQSIMTGTKSSKFNQMLK